MGVGKIFWLSYSMIWPAAIQNGRLIGADKLSGELGKKINFFHSILAQKVRQGTGFFGDSQRM